jgi:hypothetical protein
MPVTDAFDTARRIIEQGGSPDVVRAVLALIADPGTSPQVRAQFEMSLRRYHQQLASEAREGDKPSRDCR